MKKHLRTVLLAVVGLGRASAAMAQVPDTVEGHVLAAQKAAGLDFAGTLEVLCIQLDDGSDPGAAARAANAGKPRAIPARETWYAEPAKVFDNVYFVGTKIHSAWAIKTSEGIILLDTMYNYAAETEIVGGLKKLGLDPATIKYVIVSHGHGDHDEGAKLLQDRYGARVIMGGPDWDLIAKAVNMPGGGARSATSSATDGQKVTLGDTTVTILLTPGHTLGTLSFLFPVKDQWQDPVTWPIPAAWGSISRAGRSGSTPISPRPEKFGDAAKAAGASIIFSNHSMYDQAWIRSRWQRKSGEISPFVVGTEAWRATLRCSTECAKAAKLRLKGG